MAGQVILVEPHPNGHYRKRLPWKKLEVGDAFFARLLGDHYGLKAGKRYRNQSDAGGDPMTRYYHAMLQLTKTQHKRDGRAYEVTQFEHDGIDGILITRRS